MATKGASNRYKNTNGSRKKTGGGKIGYQYAKDFNKHKVDEHFKKHRDDLKINDKKEYVSKAINFANLIDKKRFRSVVDYRGTTYKYDPKAHILVEVDKKGIIISYRNVKKQFWFEPKKGGKKLWIKLPKE